KDGYDDHLWPRMTVSFTDLLLELFRDGGKKLRCSKHRVQALPKVAVVRVQATDRFAGQIQQFAGYSAIRQGSIRMFDKVIVVIVRQSRQNLRIQGRFEDLVHIYVRRWEGIDICFANLAH